jgi:hypothetical protein
VPGLPARLVHAVHRALEKDPNKRWDSCEAFYQALPMPSTPSQIELAGTMGVGPTSMQMDRVALPTPMGGHSQTRTTMPGKRRTGLWIALAAAAGVAVAGAGVAIATHVGATGPPAAAGSASASAKPTTAGSGAVAAAAAGTPTPGSAAAAAVHTAPVPTPGSASAQPLMGKLHIEGKGETPADSNLVVDGTTLGPISDRYPIAAGTHHVLVEHEGFVQYKTDVDIAADETTALEVALVHTSLARPPVHGAGSSHNPIVRTVPAQVHTLPPPHDTPAVPVPHPNPYPGSNPNNISIPPVPPSTTPKPNPYGSDT